MLVSLVFILIKATINIMYRLCVDMFLTTECFLFFICECACVCVYMCVHMEMDGGLKVHLMSFSIFHY